MRDQNVAIVEGRLVRDPELKESSKGNTVMKFSIASNGYGSKKSYDGRSESVSYFDVIAWKEVADLYQEKLKKGQAVRVIGCLSQWRWKDDSGNFRSKISIVAQNIDFPYQKKKPASF
ncbi:MAG: single-stranded DNA-binding protein [Spirochaetota bacterium]|nr:single-stranded DNA-binding protein [Spirochaetota bacterium]